MIKGPNKFSLSAWLDAMPLLPPFLFVSCCSTLDLGLPWGKPTVSLRMVKTMVNTNGHKFNFTDVKLTHANSLRIDRKK